MKHPINIPPLEMLQHVTVVDQINAVSLNEGQVVNCCNVIHVRVINGINMNEPRNKALATA